MKIGVCIKQVPDTETKMRINESREWIGEEGVKFVINPYDEFALEEALKAKEKFGGEVVSITLGPKRCQESIRGALAMGADRSIHVVCEDHKLDPLAVARVIKEIAGKESFDMLFLGKQAIDNDHAQVGPMLAQMLNWGCANVVLRLEFSADGKSLVCERESEGGSREVIELSTPAVVTAPKGLNVPRYPALKGIMAAKKKEIKEMTLESLGLNEKALNPVFAFGNLKLPPERKAGQVIQGEPLEAAKKLVELLRTEAKII